MTARLAPWQDRPLHRELAAGPQAGSHFDHHRRMVAWEEPGPARTDGPFALLADAIRRYDIFPEWIGSAVLARPVQPGDAVGLRYRLTPVLHLLFASRVSAVFHDTAGGVERSGFTYRTLAGHPEVGEETFRVTKDLATGVVEVHLQAWSHLAAGPLQLVRPLARWLQLAAGRSALNHLESLVRDRTF